MRARAAKVQGVIASSAPEKVAGREKGSFDASSSAESPSALDQISVERTGDPQARAERASRVGHTVESFTVGAESRGPEGSSSSGVQSRSSRGGAAGSGVIQRVKDPSLANLTRAQRARVRKRRARKKNPSPKPKASAKPKRKRRRRKRNASANANANVPVVVPPPPQQNQVIPPPPPQNQAIPPPPPQQNQGPPPPPPQNQVAAPPVVVPPVDDTAAKEAWDKSFEASSPKGGEALATLGKSAAGGFASSREIAKTGKESASDFWDKKLHPTSSETERTNLSEVGDIGGGSSDIVGGVGTLWEQGKRLASKDSDGFDKASASLKGLKALGGIGSGGMKIAKGAGATGGRLKDAMADTGAVTSTLGLAANTVDAAQSFKGFQDDKKRGKFDTEAAGGKGKQGKLSALARARLRGGAKGLGLAGSAAGAVKGIAGAVGGAGGSAVGAVAGAVGGGLGAAIGVGQMISGGHRLWLGHKRKKALANVQAGAGGQAEALEHLKDIQSKRQKRAGVDMAFGAGGIASGALIASGVAAPVGIALGAGLGLARLGHMAFKGIRQWGRNKAAKAAQGSRWRKVFDAEKSTDKKKAKDLETAKTVLSMNDPDMLGSLGLAHGNAFKKYNKATKQQEDMTESEKLTEITKKLRKR